MWLKKQSSADILYYYVIKWLLKSHNKFHWHLSLSSQNWYMYNILFKADWFSSLVMLKDQFTWEFRLYWVWKYKIGCITPLQVVGCIGIALVCPRQGPQTLSWQLLWYYRDLGSRMSVNLFICLKVKKNQVFFFDYKFPFQSTTK